MGLVPKYLLVLFLGLCSFGAYSQPLKVVASINPLALMVKDIAGELVEVEVLLGPGQTPHGFTLRASDRRALDQADLVLWIGAGLEPYLESLMSRRTSWAAEAALGMVSHGHLEADHHDRHLWLSPKLGATMFREIALELSRLDPTNSDIYQNNAEAASGELLSLLIEPDRPKPGRVYGVAHDAYHYLLQDFGFPQPLVASQGGDLTPGARRLWELQRKLTPGSCLLADRNHKPKWVIGLAERGSLELVDLDLMGFGSEASSYLLLLSNIKNQFQRCIYSQ